MGTTAHPRARAGLMVAILAALLLAAWLSATLSQRRSIGGSWRASAQSGVELVATDDPTLRPMVGRILVAVQPDAGSIIEVQGQALHPPGQWTIDGAQRAAELRTQTALDRAFAAPKVTLFFSDGATAEAVPKVVGLRTLHLGYWLLLGLAGVLLLNTINILIRRPSTPNLIYAVLAACIITNLVMLAAMSTGDLTVPLAFLRADYAVRTSADLVSIGAIVQAMVLHPVRTPHRQRWANLAWLVALAPIAFMGVLGDAHWWVARGVMLGLGAVGLRITYHSHRDSNHPLGAFLVRVGVSTMAIFALLTAGIATASRDNGSVLSLTGIGTILWSVFFALLMLLISRLARSREILRELALIAATTTTASAMHLLVVASFELDPLTALTVTVLLALLVYTLARQWVLDRTLGREVAVTDRLVEQIYKAMQDTPEHGNHSGSHAAALLVSVFAPTSTRAVQARQPRATVSRDGAALTVPLHATPEVSGQMAHDAVELRHAQRGRRLFTLDDARAADRIVDQLNQALAFQRARDEGRAEERLRLAQDLHDDIGARLLTLMYRAPTPELEDYIRHTLQDLKTLTRGLASGRHKLADAAAEWRNDAGHRLDAVQCQLRWTADIDDDVDLTVLEWSTMTRVLRELVSNILAHSQASRVEVTIRLQSGRFLLTIDDNGVGGHPGDWSHGLGLSSVRKRISQLQGDVQWLKSPLGGVRCAVRIDKFRPPRLA